MAIVHWDPSRDLSLLQGDMNRLFERFFTPNTESSSQRWMPAMDITEEGDEFVLRADLPGMSEDDLSIEVQDRTLTIAGERRFEQKPEHDGGFVRLERSYGSFQRSLTLPEGVDPSAIDASFDAGVLELRVPKPVEAKPHRVAIANGSRRTVEAGETSNSDAESDSGKRSIRERMLNHG